MARSVIAYDRDLPEVSDRCPWLKPDQHLIKDTHQPAKYAIVNGRRPSTLLLVERFRTDVDKWRAMGYPGASDVTQRLFQYWFDQDHEVAGLATPFRYYFGQREAIETLAYLVEIANKRDTIDLIKAFADIKRRDLVDENIVFQTTMDGRRQVRRYVEEYGAFATQDLPAENLRRYAFKMATGSGKTWVMAMAAVWSYFHCLKVPGSDLSTNFLIVAPNIIVYQRLEKDFGSGKIFHAIPLIPSEWKSQWSLKVILRGDDTEPDVSGNLFLTNIHQLYETRERRWTPQNAIDTFLGRPPQKDLRKQERPMLQRLRGLRDLVVINDEAHHVHDEDLAWGQALLAIHRAVPQGLSLWLDYSATPKDQAGLYYAWIICDYPLAQAVEDRIVKAPIVVTLEDDPQYPGHDPDHVTKENAVDKYGFWIHAAVKRWKDHQRTYRKLGVRPVLFIMTEQNNHADAIGRYLVETQEFGFRESEVLVIHTDTKGEITKKDLEKARAAARDIDLPGNRVKAIVSVMMLREGWDVRNVSVCLGLRPFSARAEILPEQVVGRGLRLMHGVSPDRTQTLEVLGTKNLLDMLRDRLEAEGVGVATARSTPQPLSVTIEAVLEKSAYDIALPITKPSLTHNVTKLEELDPVTLEPCAEEYDPSTPHELRLRMEFATTETEIHVDRFVTASPMAQELLSSITSKVAARANLKNLQNIFSRLYPIVHRYVAERCFGRSIDLDDETVRKHLSTSQLQDAIAKYLAQKIGELTVEKRTLEFEQAAYQLSETKPFSWRRDLSDGPLECKHTIFNYVATYNSFERRFAQFLDRAQDVTRFASLGTTQQGDSGTQFRVDYLKPSGAIGFYHPDWVVMQEEDEREVFWIVETKGRVWEDTPAKDRAMHDWCKRVSDATGQPWRYVRVNQIAFDGQEFKDFADVVGEKAAPQTLIV